MNRRVYDIRIELPQDADGRILVLKVLTSIRFIAKAIDKRNELLSITQQQGGVVVASAGLREVDD